MYVRCEFYWQFNDGACVGQFLMYLKPWFSSIMSVLDIKT